MIETVLFDMDGVLIDTEEVITKAAILCLKEYGITAQPSDFLPFTGMGEKKFIGGVSEKYGLNFEQKMIERTYDIYDTIANEVKVFEGVVATLQTVKDLGCKIAVCSSAHRRKVLTNFMVMGVSVDFFDAVVTAEDVVNKKPAPDVFLLGAKKTNTNPENCMVVEDAISGVQAGKAAKALVTAITTSFIKNKLQQAGADFVIDKITELPKLLKKI